MGGSGFGATKALTGCVRRDEGQRADRAFMSCWDISQNTSAFLFLKLSRERSCHGGGEKNAFFFIAINQRSEASQNFLK